MKKLLLIDGNSLLFRAFYATFTRMMKTSNNIPVNAIFTLSSMIQKILKTYNPDYCLVALDKGKQTFRHKLYDDYKANRKELPAELIPQFQIARELFEAFNIKFLEYDEYEADDIIGSLANKYSHLKIEVITGDKDLFQLINDNVSIIVPKASDSTMVEYNEKELFNRYNLMPNQMIDLKSLMGDPSDNIIGVKGVGEKTAIKLLLDYSSVDGIYQNIENIKGKLKDKLIEGKENCYLSKNLVTIKTDINIDLPIDELTININYDTLYNFYLKYEMNSKANAIKNLVNDKNEIIVNLTNEIAYVNKVSNSLLSENSYISLLVDPYNYYDGEIYGLAIGNDNLVEFIYLDDLYKDSELLEYLKSANTKYIFDLKHHYHLFDKVNIEVNGLLIDILLACYIIDTKQANYEAICASNGLICYYNNKNVFGTEIKRKDLDDNEVANFAKEKLANLIKVSKTVLVEYQDEKLKKALYEIEIPFSKVLYKMEKNGITVDINILDDIALKTSAIMDKLASNIYEFANREFNINSPAQLATVLFDDLKLTTNKKRSTAADQLEKLINEHDIIVHILEYRKFSKLYSTYAIGLKKNVFKDKKIHTIYKQTGTLTGRLSSIEPNLQNISVKDEEAKEIRKAFKASENCTLLTCDYSQVELRMLAILSNETNLINTFNNNIDIHQKTASEIFQIPLELVDDNLRRKAKAINFGIIYGMHEYGLSNQVKVDIKQAKEYIENYFLTYPNIKKYFDQITLECKEKGYVESLFNRRRYIDEINSSSYMVKEQGTRLIRNTPIQGSAADLIKLAMLNINKRLEKENLKSKMILQVHDELIFDCLNDELEYMKKLVVEEMENTLDLQVKFIAVASYGKSWYDTK